ncbi:MAG: hypothetical protein ACR2NM_09895 [Bythopirellula sp.]
MIRERLISGLFLTATLIVDFVLITINSRLDMAAMIKLGLVLGQLAALAIWAVRGKSHRLARISSLVVVTGLLTYVVGNEPQQQGVWLAFNTLYVLGIVLVTGITDLMRYRLGMNSVKRYSREHWRIPLIEFFGWTIAVAIISFGARHMEFVFLTERVLLLVLAFVSIPFLMAVLVWRDLRDLHRMGASVILVTALVAAAYLTSRRPTAWAVTMAQTGYLTLWLATLGMDEVRSQAIRLQDDLQQDLDESKQVN